MPAQRSASSTSTASHGPSRGPHLRFISPEAATTIPAYPSFRDRLSGTDTWTKASSPPAGPPSLQPGPLARAGSSSSSRTASSSLTPSLSPAPRAHSSRSPSSPRAHPYARARSTSSSATASSGASTARSTADRRVQVQVAQAAAVRDAVRRGTLDASSYTDGQLYAIREGAAQAFARGGGRGSGGSGTRSREGRRDEGEVQAREKRKRRGAGIEGREGQVVKAVKVRQSSCAVEGEGSADDEGEERVEVEVDLRRMLGL